jgi:hypothetical protein
MPPPSKRYNDQAMKSDRETHQYTYRHHPFAIRTGSLSHPQYGYKQEQINAILLAVFNTASKVSGGCVLQTLDAG